MPELPEVETVGRGLSPVMVGHRFDAVELRRPDLRFPFPEGFKARLEGKRLLSLERRAKFLIGTLDSTEALTLHLGMSGRFTIHAPTDPAQKPGQFVHEAGTDAAHDHVVFHMSNGVRIVFNDPRRFGFMELYSQDELASAPRFTELGPEPLGNSFTPDVLSAALQGKRSPIKSALLDQKVVAGLGNIYVCEALYRSGISPKRSAHTIPGKRAERLVPNIRDVLTEAIASGGSTLRDYAHTDGALGYFQHNFAVYGREGEPCQTCGAPVQRIVQSGRSTFFCGHCQR